MPTCPLAGDATVQQGRKNTRGGKICDFIIKIIIIKITCNAHKVNGKTEAQTVTYMHECLQELVSSRRGDRRGNYDSIAPFNSETVRAIGP